MDPSIFGVIPENRDGISTNVGEKNYSIAQQLCQKQSDMATVTSIDNGHIQHQGTDGNNITFKITGEIQIDGGILCVKDHHTVEDNMNFPVDVPELHFHINEDTGGGSSTISLDETLTVHMDDIYEPVAITVVVKEDGNPRKTKTFHEQAGTTGRG